MIDQLPDNWRAALGPALATPQAQELDAWLNAEEAAGKTIYPPRGQRLRAFELTPLNQVKVVILGQDPYHGPGQAHGLSFSVPAGVRQPPSLVNIFKELHSDCGHARPEDGNLEHWAGQGVLLLNNALSVEAGKAGSHQKRGWEAISDAAIAAVAAREAPTVFVLWGSHAQAKAKHIAGLQAGLQVAHHLVLQSPHPSPLSSYRGFFGSKPFSQANAFLQANGRGAVDWNLKQPDLLDQDQFPS